MIGVISPDGMAEECAEMDSDSSVKAPVTWISGICGAEEETADVSVGGGRSNPGPVAAGAVECRVWGGSGAAADGNPFDLARLRQRSAVTSFPKNLPGSSLTRPNELGAVCWRY